MRALSMPPVLLAGLSSLHLTACGFDAVSAPGVAGGVLVLPAVGPSLCESPDSASAVGFDARAAKAVRVILICRVVIVTEPRPD